MPTAADMPNTEYQASHTDVEEMGAFPVVIYGAGQRSERALGKLRFEGHSPVCFCDSDPSLWGKAHFGLLIMGIEEARKRYPMLRFHISPAEPLWTQIYLELLNTHSVPAEYILNPPSSGSCYKSCSELETFMFVLAECLAYCCNTPETIPVPPDDISTLVEKFVNRRDEVVSINQSALGGGPCHSCKNLVFGVWNPNRKINGIDYGVFGPCNLSCAYCTSRRTMEEFLKIAKPDLSKLLRYLREHDHLGADPLISLTSGEITIHPNRDAMLEAVKGYRTQIMTSCVLYDERIADLSARCGSWLNVSLDSGTPETFKLVKGRDCFPQVVENLFRYQKKGVSQTLKYIIRPENANNTDIDAFIDLVIRLGNCFVHISRDFYQPLEDAPSCVFEAKKRMIEKLQHYGVPYYVVPRWGE